jgi:hypothetical protein
VQAGVPVPALIAAEEVPVVEAKVSAPAKPRSKPVVADDDDRPRGRSRRDDDDGEDDRPRKRKKRPAYDDDDPPRRPRRRAAKGGGAVAALVVVGGLLVLVGLGAGIYFLTGKGGLLAKKAPVPVGWKQYDFPQAGFKGYFPTEPQAVMNIAGPGGFGARPGRFGGGSAGSRGDDLAGLGVGRGVHVRRRAVRRGRRRRPASRSPSPGTARRAAGRARPDEPRHGRQVRRHGDPPRPLARHDAAEVT